MKRTFQVTLVLVGLALSHAAVAESAVFNAVQRGWVEYGYSWNGMNPANNYYVDNYYRNWFGFDLSSINNQWVTGGAFEIQAFNSTSTTYTIYDFNSYSLGNLSAMWNDAGSGVQYGSAPVGWAVGLNTFARDAIMNSAFGSNQFFLGGRVSSGSAFGFSGGDPAQTRLVLNLITNSSPVAHSLNKAITLGDGVLLDGSGSFDANAAYGDAITSYMWDVDNNGVFDILSSSAILSLSAVNIASYGLGVGQHTLKLKVTDKWGAASIGTSLLDISAAASPVPEPTTLAIWSTLGGLGMIATRRSRKQAA